MCCEGLIIVDVQSVEECFDFGTFFLLFVQVQSVILDALEIRHFLLLEVLMNLFLVVIPMSEVLVVVSEAPLVGSILSLDAEPKILLHSLCFESLRFL